MPYTTLVFPETLFDHLDDPAWVVVDCRFRLDDPDTGRALYDEGHVPGARYADLDRDLSGPPTPDGGRHPLPDLDAFRAQLGAWGIGEGVQVVAYDDWGGALAARLWWMLRYLGHDAVAVLDGGWPAWVARGYPTERAEPQPEPTRFEGKPDPGMLATMGEIEALVEQGQGRRLLDARDPARFRGDHEPIDAAAGHIPGARNVPFAQNLTAAGTFRPADDLRQHWSEWLAGLDPAESIAYCGSGVSACHNLLAMTHAGLPGARLFVPSWSGWSADPARPVATGKDDDQPSSSTSGVRRS